MSHRCLVEWYDKPDNGPTHWIVLQADAAVMGLNKCLANGQSQAQAIGWAEFRYPIEFIEDPVEVFRRDTDAPIGQPEPPVGHRRCGPEPQPAGRMEKT